MPDTPDILPPPPGLFDPARHEALAGAPWNEAEALAGIQRIVAATLADFSPARLWPPHAKDDPPKPDTRYSNLYLGAGGLIWGLRRLAAAGLAPDPALFDAVVPTLLQRNRDEGEFDEGTASLLLGDAGLLLLQWQCAADAALADRLFDVVQGNLRNPALESLWGSPGTLQAAIHMAEATGDPRWAALLEQGVRILWQQMHFDDGLGAWLWQQDLYGKKVLYLGAGHGFAGNVYPVLRGAALLPADLVQGFADRALQAFQALALRADGCASWHPMHDPERVRGRLPIVQDCHGAPGLVCRLAGMPRTPEWDTLLLEAGALTWRAGPLNKGPGLCHGSAGNGYAFLKLWARSGDAVWLRRARAFAMHALAQVGVQRSASGHARHSLWTGDIGVALYLADCLHTTPAFPTLDVF